ncbi:MAG: hypothetical protein H7062_05985 [Candidatus Saccharimonas sp.]|nr:hypothetical protein [Planctomycetaceae bacterium]
MQIRSNWGLMVVVTVAAAMGCSQSRTTIRGQSPAAPVAAAGWEGQGPIIGSAPGYGQFVHGDHKPGHGNNKDAFKAKHSHHDFNIAPGFHDNNFGYEGGYYAGPEGYYTEHDRTYTVGSGGCPHCQNGQACPSDGCPHCGHGHRGMGGTLGHGPNGFPTHYQTYQYDWPQNQVYPTGPVPAGMVQYPYYTFRGPTDFFMK